MASSKLRINLQGEVIKICSGKYRWMVHKLNIASYTRTNFCINRKPIEPITIKKLYISAFGHGCFRKSLSRAI